MLAKFAKGIAANIRDIAQNAAKVEVIDSLPSEERYSSGNMEARGEYVRSMDKAEANIAAFLMQPGCNIPGVD